MNKNDLRSHIIVVEREGESVSDLLSRVVRTCHRAYSRFFDDPKHYGLMLSWVDGSAMGKIGRRCRESEMVRLREVLPDAVYDDGVLVTLPMVRERQPKLLGRTRMDGWKTSVVGNVSENLVGPVVEVNPDVSVGKAVGAVGHIATMVVRGDTGLDAEGHGLLLNQVGVGFTAEPCVCFVQDAGFTEVEPGTTTARLRMD